MFFRRLIQRSRATQILFLIRSPPTTLADKFWIRCQLFDLFNIKFMCFFGPLTHLILRNTPVTSTIPRATIRSHNQIKKLNYIKPPFSTGEMATSKASRVVLARTCGFIIGSLNFEEIKTPQPEFIGA